MEDPKPLESPSTDVSSSPPTTFKLYILIELKKKKATILTAQESSPSVLFPSFTSSIAWSLGLALRSRILSLPPDQQKPALVSIALVGAAQPHVVFQCATGPGTVVDNEVWVSRKRNTVLRWGMSSWLMRCKMLGTNINGTTTEVETAFVRKYALPSSNGGSAADDYAIHGGGFPVRVRGVDGVVGVIVVSGLKQEHDHQVIMEVLHDFIAQAGNASAR